MSIKPPSQIDPVLQKLIQRFSDERCSWLSSVRPDGRAHSAPVWHVWYRGRAYVVTRPEAVKTANIAENPSVVITHPDAVNALIIEGEATESEEMRATLQPHFKAKYDWDISNDDAYGTVFEITPTKLIAWGKHGEGRWNESDVVQVWLEEQ